MDAWWIVVLGAMAAGLVQGIAGFGFGMVAMSFWVWVLEPQAAAALAVLGAVQGQLIAAVTVRRGFNARALAPFIFGGLLGLPLGIYLLPQLDMCQDPTGYKPFYGTTQASLRTNSSRPERVMRD